MWLRVGAWGHALSGPARGWRQVGHEGGQPRLRDGAPMKTLDHKDQELPWLGMLLECCHIATGK